RPLLAFHFVRHAKWRRFLGNSPGQRQRNSHDGAFGLRVLAVGVKPANVLVDMANGRVWLIGFGIAPRLPREQQGPAPPEAIAGTLAYMAPEQTGRIARGRYPQ